MVINLFCDIQYTPHDSKNILKAKQKLNEDTKNYTKKHGPNQGFSYLSEVGTRGLLNLGKKHLDHQYWKNLMQSKKNWITILNGFTVYKKLAV